MDCISVNTTVYTAPWEAYFLQAHLSLGGGGVNRDGGLIWEGGHNLESTMQVSVLLKELEYKVEKLKYKKFLVMQLRIRIKSKLPVGK